MLGGDKEREEKVEDRERVKRRRGRREENGEEGEKREMKTRRRREIFLTRVHNRGCFQKLSHRQYFQQRDKKLRI